MDESCPPPSPVSDFVATQTSGRSLRTGYTHAYSMADGVERSPAQEFRRLCRRNDHTAHTSGFCAGFVQANFVAMPKEHAFDFLAFCLRNPKVVNGAGAPGWTPGAFQ